MNWLRGLASVVNALRFAPLSFALRFAPLSFVCALSAIGCGYNVNSIPDDEDRRNCIAMGNGNCGGAGGTGGTGNSGTGGVGGTGNSGTGGMSGTGGVGGSAGNGSCAVLEFTCDNMNCVPMGARCDGDDDCGDNSDEPFGCNVAGTGGIGGVAGVIGGIGGFAGNIGGFGGMGGDPLECGSCPDVSGTPFALEPCCYTPSTCGARTSSGATCADVFNPGLADAACPSEILNGFDTAGCCRTDGLCGVAGNLFNLGCVARADIPPLLGGPRPSLSCGASTGARCNSTTDCPPDQACSAIDFTSGQAFCAPINRSGFDIGAECFGDDQCESDLCLPFSNECSSACQLADDCTNPYRGAICASFTSGPGGPPINLCGTQCNTTANCLWDGQACSLALDADTQEPMGMCAATSGSSLNPPGTPCFDNTECSSGVCLDNFEGGFYCSALCTTGSTCPAVLPACLSFQAVFGVPAPTVRICSVPL